MWGTMSQLEGSLTIMQLEQELHSTCQTHGNLPWAHFSDTQLLILCFFFLFFSKFHEERPLGLSWGHKCLGHIISEWHDKPNTVLIGSKCVPSHVVIASSDRSPYWAFAVYMSGISVEYFTCITFLLTDLQNIPKGLLFSTSERVFFLHACGPPWPVWNSVAYGSHQQPCFM